MTIEKPLENTLKIWRYMDFTKFVSLLNDQSLFFSKADKFEDPLEGSYTRMDIAIRNEMFKNGDKAHDIPKVPEDKMRELTNMLKDLPRRVAISCWHENGSESVAMWKIYLPNNRATLGKGGRAIQYQEGIAIQSTIKLLEDSYRKWLTENKNKKIFLGRVKYLDYEGGLMKDVALALVNGGAIDPLRPFFYKSESFEHEREVRAVIAPTTEEILNQKFPITDGEEGIKVKVDLSTLIENVYVSPKSPAWFLSLVESVMKKYDLTDKEVRRSLIDKDEEPLY